MQSRRLKPIGLARTDGLGVLGFELMRTVLLLICSNVFMTVA